MKKNLTKIVMLVLTLCMMIAMFAVVTSAAAKEDIGLVAVTKSSVTYNRDGNSATKAKQQAPTVVVYDTDKVTRLTKDKDFELTDVTYTLPDGTVGYKNVDFAEAEFKYAGTYTITVVGSGKNYKGTKTVVYQITQNTNNTVENNFKYWQDSVYGEPVPNATAKSKFGVGTVRYYTKADYDAGNLDNGTKNRPTLPGEYVIRFYTPATINYAAAEKVQYITIAKREVTLDILEAEKTYGDKNTDDLYRFKYADDNKTFFENDIADIEYEFGYAGNELSGWQYGALTAVVEHPYYDVTVNAGDLLINKRTLTAEHFDVETLVYNGSLQLPKVTVNALGRGDCGVEAEAAYIGNARKYGGTYYVTINGVKNDNYRIDEDFRLEFTIVAEGEKDSDTAVKDFVDGVVNAGETVGEVVEVVTPVFNAIGKVIADGIKALVNDFFSRVFG